MTVRVLVLISIIVNLLFFLSCESPSTKATTDLKKARKEVMATETAWMKTVENKDLNGLSKFIAQDAVFLEPNLKPHQGRQVILNVWASGFELKNFTCTWEVEKIEVAASGDLAYSWGANHIYFELPDGNVYEDFGKYLTVWKKNSEGQWQSVAEAYNSNLPRQ